MILRNLRAAFRRWSASRLASILVLAVTTGLTLLATAYVAWTARQNDEARFDNAVQHTRDAVEERVNIYLAVLNATAALWAAEPEVSRESFHEFVSHLKLEERYPGLSAIGFAPRISNSERESFVNRLRRETGVSYGIRPGGEREVYFPLFYVEPSARNHPALGWDLSSDPTRFRAMSHARDIGKAATSTGVKLLQEGDENRPGFVIYIPIFGGTNVTRDIWRRREELRGYVSGAIRTADLFAGIFRSETRPPLHFDVYAGVVTHPANLLFGSPARPAARPLLSHTERFDVPGLAWTLVFRSTPTFEAESSRRWAYWIFGFGTVMSVLLFAATEALARAERRAARNLALTNAELEQTVNQRTARLRESLADLEHFSYSITHDMQAPLRAMQGYSEILLHAAANLAPPVRREYLRRIIAASERMSRLIRDSLNYAKVVREELELTPVEPEPILRDLIDTYPAFHPPLATIQLDGEFPPVQANEAALAQCFSNILGNAVKFVPPGTTPHVRVWAEKRGSRVRFYFRDNGIGIPPENQERIFGMFQRLHSPDEYPGTGVGLALVRKMVARMRGDVGVESEPGQGSMFWLEFAEVGIPVKKVGIEVGAKS